MPPFLTVHSVGIRTSKYHKNESWILDPRRGGGGAPCHRAAVTGCRAGARRGGPQSSAGRRGLALGGPQEPEQAPWGPTSRIGARPRVRPRRGFERRPGCKRPRWAGEVGVAPGGVRRSQQDFLSSAEPLVFSARLLPFGRPPQPERPARVGSERAGPWNTSSTVLPATQRSDNPFKHPKRLTAPKTEGGGAFIPCLS